MNKRKLFFILTAAVLLIATACSGSFSDPGGGTGIGGGGGGGDDDKNSSSSKDSTLSGTITISPDTNVTVGTLLTATYTGYETVKYQWKKGSDKVGSGLETYTPQEAGKFTVIVSAKGFQDKTSNTVTVTVAGSNPGGSNPSPNPGGNSGVLTFTDGVPGGTSYGGTLSADIYIIANNTNTSAANWKDNTQIVAHYNQLFTQEVTTTTLRLSIPKRSITVGDHSDVSSDDRVWTGSGNYAVYVFYYDVNTSSSVEKILKSVTFANGCATVTWSSFSGL